jgi:predicted nucleic acid-binding protein
MMGRQGNILRKGDDTAGVWVRDEGDEGHSFTDCTSFVLMRIGIHTAVALDDHFRQEGFEVMPEG